jgi:hypothetical protein
MLFFPVIPASYLAGLILPGLGDATISVTDIDTPSNELTSTEDSSASAAITITTYAVADE